MIAILCVNDFLPLTFASIRKHFPEEQILLLRTVDSVTLRDADMHRRHEAFLETQTNFMRYIVPSIHPKVIHSFLMGGFAGIVPALRSGTLVQRNFKSDVMRLPRFLRDKSMGVSQRLMYLDRIRCKKVYEEMDEDTTRNLAGGMVILNLKDSFQEDGVYPLPPQLCWGHDPMVDQVFMNHDLFKHAWYAEQAATLDYIAIATQPQDDLRVCHSAPLERYTEALRGIESYVGEEVQCVMRENAKHSAFSKNIRYLYAPMREYFDRYHPEFHEQLHKAAGA